MKRIAFLISICTTISVIASHATAGVIMPTTNQIINPDTTENGEDLNILMKETTAKTKQNKAEGFNALNYVMEHRYRGYGDTFTKKWHDHLFFEIGAGALQLIAPEKNYSFNTLTQIHLGVGKQFSKYHSLRLIAHAALGYQQDKDVQLAIGGIKIDHLFDLSSYFSGYDPTRLLSISTVMGVGWQYSHLGGVYKRTGSSYEWHGGLQLRFFSGPQGYINIEPYYGIASDKMDLSQSRNWRKPDMYYGANVNFIYYLHNNLSPQARLRFIKKKNAILADSITLMSWRQPWFVEFDNGLAVNSAPSMSMMKTMGTEVSVAIGKWFSPAIGLRMATTSSQTKWSQNITAASEATYQPAYTKNENNVYIGGRIEALINPLGFNNNYNWDSPFGFYLAAGGEYGWLTKYFTKKKLACRSEGYTAGLHLWAKLSNDFQFYIEPRYAHHVYKIPYTNADYNEKFTDDGYSIHIGFTMLTRSMNHRKAETFSDESSKGFVVGVGGGTNFIQTQSNYEGKNHFNYNGQIFGEYHFNPISSIRLSYEFTSVNNNSLSTFYDYNLQNGSAEATKVTRTGLWSHRYFYGFTNLDYLVDLTNLFSGCDASRRFRFEMFLGPTCTMLYGEKSYIDDEERVTEGHTIRLAETANFKTSFGGNAGLKIAFNLTPKIDLFMSPTIYIISNPKLSGFNLLKVNYIETINFGLQYHL